jgi:hypothetical protein
MNLAVPALVILLAPLAREPVGLSGWQKHRDPVQRRVESLLAGEPLRSGMVSIVPLFARVPSEARHGEEPVPRWAGFELRGEEITADGQVFSRIRNRTKQAVFVCAGTYLRSGRRELHLTRDGIVPAEFAALFPARTNHQTVAADHEEWGFRVKGVLPPLATGLLLHRRDRKAEVVLEPWLRRFQAPGFGEIDSHAHVIKTFKQLRRASASMLDAKHVTMVGAVFLVAGEVVGAHAFSTRGMFVESLFPLLRGLSIQAATRDLGVGRIGSDRWRRLRTLNVMTDSRARAVAFLRGVAQAESRWGESYGEGFEVLIQAAEQRSVGHAVVDHRRRVVHLAYYALGAAFNDGPAGTVLRPPVGRPNQGGSEAPPGQIDRKARPSLEEARTRPRRQGPSGTGASSGSKIR